VTVGAIDALRADCDALVEIGRGLTGDQWAATSGWAGWSVQGLVTHLAGGFWRVVDPSTLPDTTGLANTQAQALIVDARRSWSPERVLDDYRTVSVVAIDRLARLEGDESPMSMGELGHHTRSLVPNSFAFDHYTHIRADLCAPRGPIGATPPPSDERRVVPVLDWVSAALVQQNAALVESLPGAVSIEIRGVGARTITIGPGPTSATIDQDGPTFLQWITGRWSWDALDLDVSGSDDCLAIGRQLRVS
jgi:uncharacterized protein (TIGR03083 family)